MDNIKSELATRKHEVESYISFLKKLDLTNSAIISSIDDLEVFESSISLKPEYLVPADVKKILKANLYILLYNIMEAFLKQSVLRILDSLNGTYTYSKLTNTMKILWLDKCVNWFKHSSEIIESSGLEKKEYYADFINKLNDDLLVFLTEKEKTDPEEFAKRYGIPGNVDHSIFKKIAKQYGISINDGDLHAKEIVLNNLRKDRNKLAHGNISFNDFGQDLSLPDLESLSDDIFIYLEKFSKIFESYLQGEEFLK